MTHCFIHTGDDNVAVSNPMVPLESAAKRLMKSWTPVVRAVPT